MDPSLVFWTVPPFVYTPPPFKSICDRNLDKINKGHDIRLSHHLSDMRHDIVGFFLFFFFI